MDLRLRVYRMSLSIAIAHTQTDATSSPAITSLTIQWAFQNSVKIDRSEEVSGSADCARSAGFIGFPFGSPGPGLGPARRGWLEMGVVGGLAEALRKPRICAWNRADHHLQPRDSP